MNRHLPPCRLSEMAMSRAGPGLRAGPTGFCLLLSTVWSPRVGRDFRPTHPPEVTQSWFIASGKGDTGRPEGRVQLGLGAGTHPRLSTYCVLATGLLDVGRKCWHALGGTLSAASWAWVKRRLGKVSLPEPWGLACEPLWVSPVQRERLCLPVCPPLWPPVLDPTWCLGRVCSPSCTVK